MQPRTAASASVAQWPTALRDALRRGTFDGALAEAARLESRGDAVFGLLIRIVVAEHQHDAAALRELLSRPERASLRDDPSLRARLASAVAVTLGLAEALPDLQAVCEATTLPVDTKARVDACANVELAKLAAARPRAWSGSPRAELALLPRLPIPIVMLSVNGLPPAPFIVDTGAAGIALSKAYCDKNGIPYLSDHPRGSQDAAGNPVQLFPVWLTSLDAGGVVVQNTEAVVIDLPPNFKVGGIVAPHRAFAGALVELDLRTNSLRIDRELTEAQWVQQAQETVHRVPLTWDDGNVFVRTRIEQRLDAWMNFDTGAVVSIITLEAVERLGRAVDRAKATDSVSVTHHASFPKFDAELVVGGVPKTVEALTPIERNHTEGELEPVGNVGLPWMQHRRLAISRDGRTLLVTAVAP